MITEATPQPATPERSPAPATVTLDLTRLHEAWRLGLVTTAEYNAVHTQAAVDALVFLVTRQRLVSASDETRAAWRQHVEAVEFDAANRRRLSGGAW